MWNVIKEESEMLADWEEEIALKTTGLHLLLVSVEGLAEELEQALYKS